MSNDGEQAFLNAIAAQADDVEARLVFADWLEERGDPCAELIRIEESMRVLPPYSDTYWQSKPRRNELREQCSDDFLKAMGYGQKYRPVFTDVPDDWRSRWRLIREFTERWYDVPMPDVGRVGDDAVRLAKRLECRLPPSVVEWMAFTEDLLQAGRKAASEMLADGRRIVWQEGHAMLSISVNRQTYHAVHRVVERNDFFLADPIVRSYDLDLLQSGEGNFAPHRSSVLKRMTEFALSYCASNIDGKSDFGTQVESQRHLLDRLRTDVSLCAEFGSLWIAEGNGWIAVVDDALIESDFGAWIDVRIQDGTSIAILPPCLRELHDSIASMLDHP